MERTEVPEVKDDNHNFCRNLMCGDEIELGRFACVECWLKLPVKFKRRVLQKLIMTDEEYLAVLKEVSEWYIHNSP
jgi:predicted metal-binding transcription factor (methanogenesis marker protein 9)